MVVFDIPTILCEYTGTGPDASNTCRYLLDITYDNETSEDPEVSDAVLEELRYSPPAYNLTDTDFESLTVHIGRLHTELFSFGASMAEEVAVWDNINYATIKNHTEILSGRKTLSERDTSLLAIVLMPARVARRSTALQAVEECVEAHYQAYRETIAEAGSKRQAPWTGAHASELLKTQNKSRVDAVYNLRPLDLAAPPITIYHPVFAKFLTMLAEPLDQIEFTPEEINLSWTFISSSASYHNTEYSRVTAIRNVFGSAVHRHVVTGTSLTYSSGTVEPDGAVTASEAAVGAFTPISCITEVKNEIGTGECDPLAQAECMYVAIYSSAEAKAFRAACCCPALLIGIAGPNIIVSGAVFADQLIAQALTSGISVVPRLALGDLSPLSRAMCEVARLFRALKACIDELNLYYVQVAQNMAQNMAQAPDPNLPLRSERLAGTESPRTYSLSSAAIPPSSQPVFISPCFSKYRDSVGQEFTLQYVRRLAANITPKAVFLAKARGPEKQEMDVVVKFIATYGAEAHRFACQHGFAPELRFCDKIDSIGMWMIIMDYVNDRMATAPLAAATVSSLRKAVETLHAGGFVFGNLREPSIMISGDGQVKLIDFEWSGRVGEARYPVDIALDDYYPNEEPYYGWHPAVYGRGLIAKEHDIHMIEQLI